MDHNLQNLIPKSLVNEYNSFCNTGKVDSKLKDRSGQFVKFFEELSSHQEMLNSLSADDLKALRSFGVKLYEVHETHVKQQNTESQLKSMASKIFPKLDEIEEKFNEFGRMLDQKLTTANLNDLIVQLENVERLSELENTSYADTLEETENASELESTSYTDTLEENENASELENTSYASGFDENLAKKQNSPLQGVKIKHLDNNEIEVQQEIQGPKGPYKFNARIKSTPEGFDLTLKGLKTRQIQAKNTKNVLNELNSYFQDKIKQNIAQIRSQYTSKQAVLKEITKKPIVVNPNTNFSNIEKIRAYIPEKSLDKDTIAPVGSFYFSLNEDPANENLIGTMHLRTRSVDLKKGRSIVNYQWEECPLVRIENSDNLRLTVPSLEVEVTSNYFPVLLNKFKENISQDNPDLGNSLFYFGNLGPVSSRIEEVIKPIVQEVFSRAENINAFKITRQMLKEFGIESKHSYYVVKSEGLGEEDFEVYEKEVGKSALGRGAFKAAKIIRNIHSGEVSVLSKGGYNLKKIKNKINLEKDEALFYKAIRQVENTENIVIPTLIEAFNIDTLEKVDSIWSKSELFDGELKDLDLSIMFENEVFSVFEQMWKGSETMHAHGYIHQDLHSENFLVKNDQKRTKIAITDFGSIKKIPVHSWSPDTKKTHPKIKLPQMIGTNSGFLEVDQKKLTLPVSAGYNLDIFATMKTQIEIYDLTIARLNQSRSSIPSHLESGSSVSLYIDSMREFVNQIEESYSKINPCFNKVREFARLSPWQGQFDSKLTSIINDIEEILRELEGSIKKSTIEMIRVDGQNVDFQKLASKIRLYLTTAKRPSTNTQQVKSLITIALLNLSSMTTADVLLDKMVKFPSSADMIEKLRQM